jgi:hypothetical protein
MLIRYIMLKRCMAYLLVYRLWGGDWKKRRFCKVCRLLKVLLRNRDWCFPVESEKKKAKQNRREKTNSLWRFFFFFCKLLGQKSFFSRVVLSLSLSLTLSFFNHFYVHPFLISHAPEQCLQFSMFVTYIHIHVQFFFLFLFFLLLFVSINIIQYLSFLFSLSSSLGHILFFCFVHFSCIY